MELNPLAGSSSKKGKSPSSSGKSKGRPRKPENIVKPLRIPAAQPDHDEIDLTLKLCSSSPTQENAPPRALVLCEMCKVDVTPIWRRGPNGPKTLCNACGLRYRRQTTKAESAPTNEEKPSTGGAA